MNKCVHNGGPSVTPMTGSSSGSGKYYRRSGETYTGGGGGRRKGSADKHVAVIIFTVLFVYVWIMLIVYYYDQGHSDQPYSFSLLNSGKSKGITFSLEKSPQLFSYRGFRYFESNPIASTHPTLNSEKVWFLPSIEVAPFSAVISLKSIQSRIVRSTATQVSLFIKYHIRYHRAPSLSPYANDFIDIPHSASLRVSSYNYRTHEMTTVDLDQYGSGYCTKVVFLGPVNEVSVEGWVDKGSGGAFVMIDELLVGLGLYVFDEFTEETCS